MTELFSVLSLRTHPFRPETDRQGQQFNTDSWTGPLNPLRDPRIAAFYYDLYDWEKSALIRRILPGRIFENFPSSADIAGTGPMMILIVGPENSGRESLRNLILLKIKVDRADPLIVPVSLVQNPAENFKKIATLFSFYYTEEEKSPTEQKLKDTANRAADARGMLSVEAYETVFQMWRTLVAAVCTRPLVLLASGAEDYDLWRLLYASTSQLFDFLIVLTKDELRATTCNQLLRQDGRNCGLIKARQLEMEMAKTYVATRLASQRPAAAAVHPQPDLSPFATEALEALYEPGAASPQHTVRWSIGWLNRILARALDEHLEHLKEKKDGGMDLTMLPPDELQISAAAIRAVQEKINQGN